MTIQGNTKTVKIGNKTFEIPAHMDKASMAECWEGDSKAFQQLAQTIMDTNPRFAWEVVNAWLTRHGQLLIPKDYHGKI